MPLILLVTGCGGESVSSPAAPEASSRVSRPSTPAPTAPESATTPGSESPTSAPTQAADPAERVTATLRVRGPGRVEDVPLWPAPDPAAIGRATSGNGPWRVAATTADARVRRLAPGSCTWVRTGAPVPFVLLAEPGQARPGSEVPPRELIAAVRELAAH